jgi:hypothetical protein
VLELVVATVQVTTKLVGVRLHRADARQQRDGRGQGL